jgi:hypothetical protein
MTEGGHACNCDFSLLASSRSCIVLRNVQLDKLCSIPVPYFIPLHPLPLPEWTTPPYCSRNTTPPSSIPYHTPCPPTLCPEHTAHIYSTLHFCPLTDPWARPVQAHADNARRCYHRSSHCSQAPKCVHVFLSFHGAYLFESADAAMDLPTTVATHGPLTFSSTSTLRLMYRYLFCSHPPSRPFSVFIPMQCTPVVPIGASAHGVHTHPSPSFTLHYYNTSQ